MPSPVISPELMENVAYRFKLLGEPMRLRLIYLLKDGPLCVQDLVEKSGAGQANVSKHLSLLSKDRIVNRRKEGLHVYYYIDDPSIFELCEIVCSRLVDDVKNLTTKITVE